MDPATVQASNEIGTLLAARRFDEALVHCQRALDDAPAIAFVWLQKGQAELELERFEAALASLTRALDLPPEPAALRPLALRYQADALVGLEREEEAIAVYRASLTQKHAAQRGAWLGLGLALLTLGRVGDAREALEESARLGRPIQHFLAMDLERFIGSPAVGGVLFRNRGWVRYQAGQIEVAIRNLTKAIELDPLDASAYYYRGSARQGKREMAAAIADLSTAIGLKPDPHVYGDRANVRIATGDLVGAIDDCTRAIALRPDDVVAHVNRAVARGLVGDSEGALADYTTALGINPVHCDARRNRGCTYMEQGSLDLAISDFNRALEVSPQWAEAYANRARALRLRGDHAAAIADAEAAMGINGRLDDPYVERAAARLELGDSEGAMEDCRKALWLNPRRKEASDIFTAASGRLPDGVRSAEDL